MEGKWLGAGLSHVLEHMLFKGTTTRPGSRIDQEVQDAGGYMNAYTSFDRTVFHINVPNTGTKVAIDILCDIMQNASLPDAELAKELDVIRREMDMNRDDPGRRSGQRLFESAYTRNPCRFTVIGYPEIFNELKPDDIRAYYRERYVPNNIFLVVGRRHQPARSPGRKFSRPSPTPKPGPLPPSSFPPSPARPPRAKSSKKRPSNWPIFISPGTSPTSAIPTCPPWTSSPPSSATAAAPASSAKSARKRASSPPPTPGLTPRATRAFSA